MIPLRRRFSPVQLGGCVLWLDATRRTSLYTTDAGSTGVVNSGDVVGRWEDMCGATNHAIQASASKRATYNPTGCNGRPGITFDGVDDVLSTPGLTLVNATVFAVVYFITSVSWDNSGPWKLADTESGVSTNGRTTFRGSVVTVITSPSPFGTNGWFVQAVDVPAAGAVVQYTYQWGDTSATIRRDGTQIGTGSPGGYATPSGALPFHVAAAYSTARLNACFGEIIVFNSVISSAKYLQTEKYLKKKWGTP